MSGVFSSRKDIISFLFIHAVTTSDIYPPSYCRTNIGIIMTLAP